MKKLLNKRGQFSIVAALLVAIVLVTAIITTYSIIRNSPLEERPQILGSTDEMNLAISHILEFVIGYYGSILQVTGNTTYAKSLAADYLRSGLENIAYIHPDWSPSFQLNYFEVSASWWNRTSYSQGTVNVTYSLLGMGLSGIQYATSAGLKVTVNPSNTSSVLVNVTRDGNKPCPNLSKNNFFFYNYSYTESAWELKNTGVAINSVSSNDTYSVYNITILSGLDPTAYMVQVADHRGITVSASTFSHYTYTFTWNQTLYSGLSRDTIVVEALQNGTLRWLDQNLQLSTQGKPIPPLPVKALHINRTVDDVNHEVPFQVETWGSNYHMPLGLTSNASIFNGRNMLVFLVNHEFDEVEKVTLWWDGRDTATQTSYAWKNRYFNDDPNNGILANENLTLILDETYLYVDGFDRAYDLWRESGSSPYLDDSDSYIYDDDDLDTEGWFSFQDLTGVLACDAASKSVKIQFECRRSGDDYFDFRVDDGTGTHGPYSVTSLSNSYGWETYDISSIIDDWKEINNMKIDVRYRRSGSTGSTVYIRRCRLLIDFWVTSVVGNSSAKADFLRINGESPVYGADPAYVIHHGIVRDIVQQEAEWSGGATDCPNVYSQIVLTLPANATYYTYALRTIFVNSSGINPARTLNELSVLELSVYPGESGTGECITEDGINATGFPIPSYLEDLFYNSSSATGWAHHWSEFLKGNNGAGIMFTNNSNFKLYTFDSIAGDKTGALDIDKQALNTTGHIEINPVERYQASFTNPLDVTWHGAVVTFEDEPIYESSNETGLWVMVEHPPIIAVS